MAKMTRETLNWTNVNVDTMPLKLKKLYVEYKRLNTIANDARNAFNDAFTKQADGKLEVPEDIQDPELVIGHGFGKLSFAWRERRKRRASGEFSFE